MLGWKSRWYASKQEFAELLLEDQKIRNFIKNHPKRTQYRSAGIDRIEIERTRDEVKVILFVARPGLDHRQEGAGGRVAAGGTAEPDRPPGQFEDRGNRRVRKLQAQLVAEDIAQQLSKRASFRRTMKRAMEQTMDAGAKGIKIQLAGRLGGSEMARREKADRRIDSAEHLAGQHRLRVYRSDDGPGAHWRSGLDQPRYVRRRRVRWL